MSSYNKGVEFEKFIAEILRKAGFTVQHNVVLRGKSGAKHQIDILAVYRTPIVSFRVLVECKNWRSPVNKDVVMKVFNEVQDLGLDKGVIVTQSYATEDALRFASSVNIDIIDGFKLARILNELGVKELKELTKTRVPPTEHVKFVNPPNNLLERVREKFGSYKLLYIPLYILSYTIKLVETKGIIRRSKVVREQRRITIIDGIYGRQVFLSSEGIVFGKSILVPLSSEEIAAYKALGSLKQASAEQIASLIGVSTTKARRLLEGLVAKGFAKKYTIRRRTMYEYEQFLLAYEEWQLALQEHDSPIPESRVLKPLIDLGKVLSLVEEVTGIKIDKHRMLYYPVVVIEDIDEIRVIDGFTGKYLKQPELIVELLEIFQS